MIPPGGAELSQDPGRLVNDVFVATESPEPPKKVIIITDDRTCLQGRKHA
jgi:hypothetical protein